MNTRGLEYNSKYHNNTVGGTGFKSKPSYPLGPGIYNKEGTHNIHTNGMNNQHGQNNHHGTTHQGSSSSVSQLPNMGPCPLGYLGDYSIQNLFMNICKELAQINAKLETLNVNLNTGVSNFNVKVDKYISQVEDNFTHASANIPKSSLYLSDNTHVDMMRHYNKPIYCTSGHVLTICKVKDIIDQIGEEFIQSSCKKCERKDTLYHPVEYVLLCHECDLYVCPRVECVTKLRD